MENYYCSKIPNHLNVPKKSSCQSYPSPRFGSCGESPTDDLSAINESSPMKITCNQLCCPALREENDNWGFTHPESLASTLIYGDTIENNLIERSPYLSDRALTLPALKRSISEEARLPDKNQVQLVVRETVSPSHMGEEPAQLSSSATLLTEECSQLLEPVTAKVQYHRKRRLEWRLVNIKDATAARMADRDSWTVYDDLVEDQGEGINCALQSNFPAQSNTIPDWPAIPGFVPNYWNEKFINFENGMELPFGYCYAWPARPSSDVGIMTEREELEDDLSQKLHNTQCLPFWRCVSNKKRKRP